VIKLKTPLTSTWLPEGDGNGNPLKVTIDTVSILTEIRDHHSRILRVAWAHGYVDDGGIFHVYQSPAGAIQVHDDKLALADKYDAFLDSAHAKGSKGRNYREEDLEDLMIEQGIVDGVRI
jgi:hypothetical protein